MTAATTTCSNHDNDNDNDDDGDNDGDNDDDDGVSLATLRNAVLGEILDVCVRQRCPSTRVLHTTPCARNVHFPEAFIL